MPTTIKQGPGTEALPPAGDARDDELKRRADDLEKAADERYSKLDVGVTDPYKFEVESELAQHFNELEVSNQDPAYAYCWIQSGFYGRMVKMKLAEGWEVVQGEMREAEELKGMGADTTRRLGDVILMRCRRDRYSLIKRREEAKRQAVEASVTGNLAELGERFRGTGAIVHTDLSTMNPRQLQQLQARSRAQAQATAMQDQWVREGRVPGNPAPGR